MTVATLPSSTQPGHLSWLWDWLTLPSAQITDKQERRRARLLSSILIVVVVLLGITLMAVALQRGFTSGSGYGLLVGLLAVYGISRTRYQRVTSWLTLVAIMYGIHNYANSRADSTAIYILSFQVLVVLVAVLILNYREVLMTIGLVLLVTSGMWLYKASTDFGEFLSVMLMLSIVSTLLIAFMRQRDLLEAERQAELRQKNSQLEQTNVDLKRANALAKEATRLKSEFLSTMSHELRTPLNAMLGFSGIMLEGMGGTMDEDATYMVQRIHSNSHRLLGLINDVLDLAKIEAGRMEVVQQPFELRALAAKWQADMSVLAQSKGLALSVEVHPDLPSTLVGDAARITQVATNLLSNAIKFTENGSVQLSLKQSDDTWLIQVRDTGAGIPPHALNYIFEEFRQVDGTSMRKHGGSGLGLAITRNLCRLMGGTIQVSSELGKGSLFTAALPLVVPAAETPLAA